MRSVTMMLEWPGGTAHFPPTIMAGELGFEPRLTESESAVLPLNYSPKPLRFLGFLRSAKVLSL